MHIWSGGAHHFVRLTNGKPHSSPWCLHGQQFWPLAAVSQQRPWFQPIPCCRHHIYPQRQHPFITRRRHRRCCVMRPLVLTISFSHYLHGQEHRYLQFIRLTGRFSSNTDYATLPSTPTTRDNITERIEPVSGWLVSALFIVCLSMIFYKKIIICVTLQSL